MAAMTAKHYLSERGVNVGAARFAGDYIAVREKPEPTELVHKEGNKVVFTKWQPPKGAKMWTLWTTGGLGTEPYTDVWTMARGWGFAFSCYEWPSLAEHWTGGFKTEAAALKEAARIVKQKSDELDNARKY